jgi:hypothetical protein
LTESCGRLEPDKDLVCGDGHKVTAGAKTVPELRWAAKIASIMS